MVAAVATYSGRSIEWNRMKGNGTEAKNLGWGDGVSGGGVINTAAIGDVNLFHPLTEARVAGTSTLLTGTQLADTYQVTGTITAGGSRAVTEVGLFDSTTLSAQATLTNSLSNVATGSQVTSAQSGTWPSSGNFFCQLENEVVLATWVDGTHINILTRGVLGTANVSHNAAASLVLGGDGGAGTGGATSTQTATVGSANGGNMLLHADFATVNLLVNDSIAFTIQDKLT